MWPMIGGLLSAGSSLLGGILGSNNQDKINQENIAASQDFAQHGIQWRVADAKAAGINPLAALGASTPSAPQLVGNNDMGAGVANAGQDIGRAMQAMQSPEDKAAATLKTKLDLEAMQLDNDIRRASLASSLRKASQPGTPPGLPGRWVEGGSFPDIGYVNTARGGRAQVMSKPHQDRGYGSLEEGRNWFRNDFFFHQPPDTPKGKWWNENMLTGDMDQYPVLYDLGNTSFGKWWNSHVGGR